MPDINMCDNEECRLRRSCYRFMAIPDDPFQWYESYAVGIDGKCEGRLPMSKKQRAALKKLRREYEQ